MDSPSKLNNEGTKEQIKRWLQNAVENAKKPNPKKKIIEERNKKSQKIAKKFGF